MRGEDQTAAVFLGPDAKKQARNRPGQNGSCNEKAELRLIEAKLSFDPHANDRKNRPNRKAGRKGNGAEPEGSSLIGFPDCSGTVHDRSPWRLCLRHAHCGLADRGGGFRACNA